MSEMINNCMASADILYNFGDFLIELFGNEYVKNVAVPCWKVAIDEHRKIIKFLANKPNNKKFILGYADKVKRYDPSYETPYI